MPTSRTRAIARSLRGLGAATALTALAALGAGCAADATGDVATSEAALGEDVLAAGIAEGSPAEEGVLLLANDRASTEEVLRADAGLPVDVASAIAAFRTDAEGRPRWFASLDEVDALAGTDADVFVKLLAHADRTGFVEAPGFDPPTLARLAVPTGLGRPPTSDDVTVEAGFDGKSPDEVLRIVRSRLTNTVHERNASFVDRTITDNHKAFTLALNNLFVPHSPNSLFASGLVADELLLLGTMSAVSPTLVAARRGTETTYYTRGAGGGFEQLRDMRYPVIMRARLQRADGATRTFAGVRIAYPAWRAKVLTAPTGEVIEP